jgi:hypothetical protein
MNLQGLLNARKFFYSFLKNNSFHEIMNLEQFPMWYTQRNANIKTKYKEIMLHVSAHYNASIID